MTRKAHTLGRKLTHDFINLSHKEALFCMGAQATGYKKASSGCPNCVTAYYMMIQSEEEGMSAMKVNEVIDHL